MKEKKQDIVVSKKHVKLRIIIFILLVVIASVSFFIAIRSITNVTSGYQKLEGDKNDTYPYINSYLTSYYYIEGKTSEIRTKLKSANQTYDNIIKKIYALTDEKNEYSDYISIGYINNHLGEDIKVDSILLNILDDAYQKTLEKKNYSLFSNLIFDYWNTLFNMEDEAKEYYDPLYYSDNANYLNELTTLINDIDNFILVINKEKSTVHFDLSKKFKDFLNNYGITTSVLSLNRLKDAYVIKYVQNELAKYQMNDSYFVSENLVIATSDISKELPVNILNDDLAKTVITSVKIKANSGAVESYRYSIDDSLSYNPYYTIDGIKRSNNLDLSDGLQKQLINFSLIVGSDIVSVVYFDNYLNCFDSISQIKEELLNSSYQYYIIFSDNTVFSNFE